MERLKVIALLFVLSVVLLLPTTAAGQDAKIGACLPSGVYCDPTNGFASTGAMEYRYGFDQSVRWSDNDRSDKESRSEVASSGLLTITTADSESCEMSARVSHNGVASENLLELRFATSGGRIHAVCLGARGTAISSTELNLRRGLLSMLQTSVRDVYQPTSLVETDILGHCVTYYQPTGPNSFRKTKKLEECDSADRFATAGGPISGWFSGVSPQSAGRLISGSHLCDVHFHPIFGSIDRVNCTEQLIMASPMPEFTGQAAPVKLNIQSSLRLIEKRSLAEKPSILSDSIVRRTNLVYENDAKFDDETEDEDFESLRSVLIKLCNESSSAPAILSLAKLIRQIRNSEPLELLYQWIVFNAECSNQTVVRWLYMKSLAYANTDAALVATFRLLANKNTLEAAALPQADRQRLLEILADQSAKNSASESFLPSSGLALKTGMEFLRSCLRKSGNTGYCSAAEAGQALLAVSAVARRTIASVDQRLASELAGLLTRCLTDVEEADEKGHLADFALLAIGNLGPDWATESIVIETVSTVKANHLPIGRRLLAVEALRRLLPTSLASSALERLVASPNMFDSSDTTGRRLQAAALRALIPRCSRNFRSHSISPGIERLWSSRSQSDAALANYAFALASQRLNDAEASAAVEQIDQVALKQLRRLVERPPVLYTESRALKPIRAGNIPWLNNSIDIRYELDWEITDAVSISLPSRAEFQLLLHCPVTGFAISLINFEIFRQFDNNKKDRTAVIRRKGDVVIAADWVSEATLDELKRLLSDQLSSASIESVSMPSTLRVPTSLGQALLVSNEAAIMPSSGLEWRPASLLDSFIKTDGSFIIRPSFSVYASRSAYLTGLFAADGYRYRSRRHFTHRVGFSGEGRVSLEMFWRRQTSIGNSSLSFGLRSPLERQELLKIRLMTVQKNLKSAQTASDSWMAENPGEGYTWKTNKTCTRAFLRTLTGHNICFNVNKHRQLTEWSLVLERQDSKAELFEATFEWKTSKTNSATRLIIGNRNSPQRHFGLNLVSRRNSSGNFLELDISNPVFPVSLNSSLESKNGIARASLRAGSQSYQFRGSWNGTNSDWRLTGDVSRLDRPWQKFGLDVRSDDSTGTGQLTLRFPNGSRSVASLDGDFGSLTLGRTLRLRAADFNATVFARLNERNKSETASFRFGVAGGLVSNGSSARLELVHVAEANQRGVGWMQHRIRAAINRLALKEGNRTLGFSLNHYLAFAMDRKATNNTFIQALGSKLNRTDRLNISLTESRGAQWISLAGMGEASREENGKTTGFRIPQAAFNLSISRSDEDSTPIGQARAALVIESSFSNRSVKFATSMSLSKTNSGKVYPNPVESFNLNALFTSAGLKGNKELIENKEAIELVFRHYWPKITVLNQTLLLKVYKHRSSRVALHFQQSVARLSEGTGLEHRIIANGSLVRRGFSLNNNLFWLPDHLGYYKLISSLESNGRVLLKIKQQIELASLYDSNQTTLWHQTSYEISVNNQTDSSPRFHAKVKAAVDDSTTRSARQLVSGEGRGVDRGNVDAVTAKFLRQLWILVCSAKARQSLMFGLDGNAMASVKTHIDAVDLKIFHHHFLQKGWGSSQVLMKIDVSKQSRELLAEFKVAGRGSLTATLANLRHGNYSLKLEAHSDISGRKGLLLAKWNLPARFASFNFTIASSNSHRLASNLMASATIDLTVGWLRLFAEQPDLMAIQWLEINRPVRDSLFLYCGITSFRNRLGPDVSLVFEHPAGGKRLLFQLNTSRPIIQQIGINYSSSVIVDGYVATATYVRYGHEFRADARGRGKVSFGSNGTEIPLMNFTFEQDLDLHGLEDAAPFSDILKQLRLSGRLIVTRRAELDLAWSLISPVSTFGEDPVVGMELLTYWWPLHLRFGVITPIAHWRRCSTELRCQLSRRGALVSAGLSGPSSDFLALYEHEIDDSSKNFNARLLYQNNLLILTLEPQFFIANLSAAMAEREQLAMRSIVKSSWKSLQQLEFVATPAAVWIDRLAHDESLRILEARRVGNQSGTRHRNDWVLGVAFGTNPVDAFVANASVGLTTGGGVGGEDFDLKLTGTTAGLDILNARIYRLTTKGSSKDSVIGKGLQIICPTFSLNATEEAAGSNQIDSKRWQLFLNDGYGLVTADVRFKGDRLDQNPGATSSVVIRGIEYSVEQPDGPGSLRITTAGASPVDLKWSGESSSPLKFSFSFASLHQPIGSEKVIAGRLSVDANLPSHFRMVYGRDESIASINLRSASGSFVFIHSVTGSFDGLMPLAPELSLRLPVAPGLVNVTAAWTAGNLLSDGLLNIKLWSRWRLQHRHRISSEGASNVQIETVSNSFRLVCNRDSKSQTVKILGAVYGIGEVSATEERFHISSAGSAGQLHVVYPNLFKFPWRSEANFASIRFAANLTAPVLGLAAPVSAQIIRTKSMDEQSGDRDVSLVGRFETDNGLRNLQVAITKTATLIQGSRIVGLFKSEGFEALQTMRYEAEANWRFTKGQANLGFVCRGRLNQLLRIRTYVSQKGITEFSVEEDARKSLCRGRFILPYFVDNQAPLLHFSWKDRVRVDFNTSSRRDWRFEWLTPIRNLVASKETVDGVSVLRFTPDLRRTPGIFVTNSPDNGTMELRLPWRSIRLVKRQLTAHSSELILWPDAYKSPLNFNRLYYLNIGGDEFNYTIELTSSYLASPGFVFSLATNASSQKILIALSRAANLRLTTSFESGPLKQLKVDAILRTPSAKSRLKANAILPDESESIGPLALKNGRFRLEVELPPQSSVSTFSSVKDKTNATKILEHDINFEFMPFQRLFYSVKDGPLLDLSFNQAFGRLSWSLLASRGSTRSKPEMAGRLLASLDAANADARVELSSGALRGHRRIYWPQQVSALVGASFNGSAAYFEAVSIYPETTRSVRDARKIDLWLAESVPANVSFGFAGIRLYDNGSLGLVNAWRLPTAPTFNSQLLSSINSRLIENLPSATELRKVLASMGRLALNGSANALMVELFAWQVRPDSDLTLAAADLATSLDFIRNLRASDEFYLNSTIAPLLKRLIGHTNQVSGIAWQLIMKTKLTLQSKAPTESKPQSNWSLKTVFERLAMRWRHATSAHIGRLRRTWRRLYELDGEKARAAARSQEADLNMESSSAIKTAASLLGRSARGIGLGAASRLRSILFGHLADYRRLYEWMDDLAYDFRRLAARRAEEFVPELQDQSEDESWTLTNELKTIGKLWLHSKRPRSNIFHRLAGVGRNIVLSWQPKCEGDCAIIGGIGVARFRALIRAKLPRLTPAEWRRLADGLWRLSAGAMDALDLAVAAINR